MNLENIEKYIKIIMNNNFFNSIFIVCVGLILLEISKKIFKKIYSKYGKNIGITFLYGTTKAFIILSIIIKIVSKTDLFTKFANTILMSSSLLVVVFGFIFQEGLSNIIHGFILTLFKPFDIGDRVQINIDGEIISGYVKSINLRHTTIISIIDNAESIIANSKLDNATIRNLSNQNETNKYPIIVSITYEDAQNTNKLKLAKKILSDSILSNERTIDTRENKKEDLFVKVDYTDSSVTLTCFVTTKTAEDNVTACSEIKEQLLKEYYLNDISFAYNHLDVNISHQQKSK